MSMSTHIVGFREPDEEHLNKVHAVIALRAAKIDIPDELMNYFGDSIYEKNFNSDCGLEVEIENYANKYNADYKNGWEVTLEDLPPGVVKIRFYNAY